ncbi:MFS transporter [Actinacidiphila bryophytorum]|uniref:Niacin transporter NiaP n=1 Tax=Actinacidiphila bryophytorum TaxID=1436133 RepID=A0A9W4E3U5_9ACTN|nr:MFS transporter [Actinacidiphila bryophytorum]MBM9438479.1 MFS transporter [Actinacidiphila bryophytorum]MBN6542885.1 MFS transporter [Actinacidiphila bryophytorum]CAG7613187.1 Niacin transporter NiaP [Actinacidiphila bryophytorum]
MSATDSSPKSTADKGAALARPSWFWGGLVLLAAGLALHVPMYFAMHGGKARMGTDMGSDGSGAAGTAMTVGMVLVGLGLALSLAGLVGRVPAPAARTERYRVVSEPQAGLTAAHVRLITALSLALVVDVMKPATLAFILPGMKSEYGLTQGQVSVLPVVALTGTVVGSLAWGRLGDRVGRRATVLMSCLVFAATTVCAVMPTFEWNLVMCFLMGAGAGGLIPIAYAMAAESLPPRHRGLVMVLQAGLATVIAYFATSGLALLLIPHFGWRTMWFAHVPFVGLLLLLNRWLPESPRFLAETGRMAEARAVGATYGMVLVVEPALPAGPPTPGVPTAEDPAGSGAAAGWTALFGPRWLRRTTVVGGYALAWGLINWGYMTFLPTLLKDASVAGTSPGALLFLSSLLAIPATLLVAVCYTRWSSRKAMVLYGMLTVAALGLLAVTDMRGGRVLTIGLLALLITGTTGIVAMLAPYAAEIYPTGMRAVGSGLTAACTKAGGMFGPPALAALIAQHSGGRLVALTVALPMAAATAALALYGEETAGRDLEEDDEPSGAAAGVPAL